MATSKEDILKAIEEMSAGFDSRTHEKVSKSSAELQLVNLIFHIFKWRK